METTALTSEIDSCAYEFLPRNHVAVLYNSDEELAGVVTRYLSTALNNSTCRHKCLYLCARNSLDSITNWLISSGQFANEDVQSKIRSQDLVFLNAKDLFTQVHGFEQVLAFWQRHFRLAEQQGYQCLMALVEMHWVLETQQRAKELLQYESRIDHIINQFTKMICLYDRQTFCVRLQKDLIARHPVAVVKGIAVVKNCYYVPDSCRSERIRSEKDYALDQNAEGSKAVELLEFRLKHLLETNLPDGHRSLIRFVAAFAHELRTPLNAIITAADLLRGSKDPLTEAQRMLIQMIHDSGLHLHKLLLHMLHVSVLESDTLMLNEEKFDIRALIASMGSLFRTTERQRRAQQNKLTEEGIEISTAVDENVPQLVVGDEMRLRQILINILSNALKATKLGYVRLRVTRIDWNPAQTSEKEERKEKEPMCELQFTCEDSGRGIPHEECEEIFKPFRQGPRTEYDPAPARSTHDGTGVGLGLSICRSLCALMGGQICLDLSKTRVGYGTTIHFTVKLKTVEEQEEEEQEESNTGNTKDAATRVRLQQLRILLVEDNAISRVLATKLLQRAGVEHIDIAENGTEAILAVRRRDYNVILMDLLMPEMGGIEAAKRIRTLLSILTTKRVAIIAWSASIQEACEDTQGVFDHWLTKPTSVENLTQILETVIERSQE